MEVICLLLNMLPSHGLNKATPGPYSGVSFVFLFGFLFMYPCFKLLLQLPICYNFFLNAVFLEDCLSGDQ